MNGVPLDDLKLGDIVQVTVSRAVIFGVFTGYGKMKALGSKDKIWVIWIAHRPIPAKLIHSIMYATEEQLHDAKGKNP